MTALLLQRGDRLCCGCCARCRRHRPTGSGMMSWSSAAIPACLRQGGLGILEIVPEFPDLGLQCGPMWRCGT
eukprot:6809862-Pyramimonas_sp.AAC.1